MVRVFDNGLGDWDSIPGQVMKKRKSYLMPTRLTFSLIRYGSRVSRAMQGKE